MNIANTANAHVQMGRIVATMYVCRVVRSAVRELPTAIAAPLTGTAVVGLVPTRWRIRITVEAAALLVLQTRPVRRGNALVRRLRCLIHVQAGV